jgi:hypothetical protein
MFCRHGNLRLRDRKEKVHWQANPRVEYVTKSSPPLIPSGEQRRAGQEKRTRKK